MTEGGAPSSPVSRFASSMKSTSRASGYCSRTSDTASIRSWSRPSIHRDGPQGRGSRGPGRRSKSAHGATLEAYVHAKRPGELLEATIEEGRRARSAPRRSSRRRTAPTRRTTTIDFDFLSAGNVSELRQIYAGRRRSRKAAVRVDDFSTRTGSPRGEPHRGRRPRRTLGVRRRSGRARDLASSGTRVSAR